MDDIFGLQHSNGLWVCAGLPMVSCSSPDGQRFDCTGFPTPMLPIALSEAKATTQHRIPRKHINALVAIATAFTCLRGMLC